MKKLVVLAEQRVFRNFLFRLQDTSDALRSITNIHERAAEPLDIKYNATGQICTFYWTARLPQSRPDYRRKNYYNTMVCRTASDLATAESKTAPSTKPIDL